MPWTSRVPAPTHRFMTLSLSSKNRPQFLRISERRGVAEELTKERLPRLVSSVSTPTTLMIQSAFVLVGRSS